MPLAAQALRRSGFADAGVHVVYLTGRVRPLQFLVPGWLEEHDFPEGSLQLRSLSSPDDQAEYKARVLRDFSERGWQILAAFDVGHARAGVLHDRSGPGQVPQLQLGLQHRVGGFVGSLRADRHRQGPQVPPEPGGEGDRRRDRASSTTWTPIPANKRISPPKRKIEPSR